MKWPSREENESGRPEKGSVFIVIPSGMNVITNALKPLGLIRRGKWRETVLEKAGVAAHGNPAGIA